MDITPYVDSLRRDLFAAAEAGGPDIARPPSGWPSPSTPPPGWP